MSVSFNRWSCKLVVGTLPEMAMVQTIASCAKAPFLVFTGAYAANGRETLESVSSCTRFSGILKISNFGFNRSSSKLVSMFFGIVPMFVLKDFVQDCFIAQICAKMCVRAVIRAYLRDEAIRNKILGYEHWNYPKEYAYKF